MQTYTQTPTQSTAIKRSGRLARIQKLVFAALSVCLLTFSMGGQALAATCPSGMSKLDCDSLYGDWPQWVPDNCPAAGTDPADTSTVVGSTDPALYLKYPHIKEAFQFFMQHGFNAAQSAGIVGNLMAESGESINPKDTGDYRNGVPTSFGIAQWHNGRATEMVNWVTAWSLDNKDPDGRYSFKAQLNFIIYDLNGAHKSIRDGILLLDTPEEAAIYWNRKYEVSADYSTKRPDFARGIYNTALTQKWITTELPPDSAQDNNTTPDADANSGCISSSSIVGTVTGTTCKDIGKTSASSTNPYVCDNPEVKCPVGEDKGTATGYLLGQPHTIRICRVRSVVTVNAFIAGNIDAMIGAAAASHIRMTGGGFRTLQQQIDVRRSNCGTSYYDIWEKPASDCNPPAARPKWSNHQMGLAVDWSACTGPKCSTSLIDSHSDAGYIWMAANASKFGFKNLPSEPWHWSVDGK